MKALVTGGYFDRGGDGVVWLVDLASERSEVLLRWMPPPHLHVPTKGFAGGCLGEDGLLYVAAHAAVVRIDPSRAVVTGVLHQPCMNDLHHVAVIDGRLFVSNTGLSAVDVLSFQGDFLGSHALLPAWANCHRIQGDDLAVPPPGWSGEPPTLTRTSRSGDDYYDTERRSMPFHRQKVPDYLHVNHVARLGSRLLATCFADGTLRELGGFGVVASLGGRGLHDGVAYGDGFWLTTIDGQVIELDSASLHERRCIDTISSGHHGWCRGLVVTDDSVAVGLTEVRRDRVHPRWVGEPEGSETSVLLLDRRDGRLLARADLTDRDRHAKLYSILPIELA